MDTERLKQMRLRIEMDDNMFPGWKKLRLGGRDLQYPPMEIFSLAEIEILILSPERQSCLHFRLIEVPNEIGKLINLRVLILDTNELEELPDQFSTLTRLERVCLSNNFLSSLPPSFNKLVNLKSLHCANNELEVFPAMLCDLKLLEFIDLSDNKLNALPRDISKLFNLHTLILFLNRLHGLPDTICGMTSLRCLWLGDNQITKLPPKFGQLHNLDWGATGRHMLSSIIDGNPLQEPPIHVCRQGVIAIAQYFGDTGGNQPTGANRRDSVESNNSQSSTTHVPRHLVSSKQSTTSSITSVSSEQEKSQPQFNKGRGRFNRRPSKK